MIEFRAQVKLGNSLTGEQTGALKFLTWQFKRSPDELVQILNDIARDSDLTDQIFPRYVHKNFLF